MRQKSKPPSIAVHPLMSIGSKVFVQSSPSLLLPSTPAAIPSSAEAPFTPGPMTAIYLGAKHTPTAFNSPFTFFYALPFEVREKIYEHLIDELVISVNANIHPSIKIFKRRLLVDTSPARPYSAASFVTLPYISVARHSNNFLCISKQFFYEVRAAVYRCIIVKFDRRWDFLNAYINGTLHAGVTATEPSGPDALTLFPRESNVFAHIRELHLNLCRDTDFDGRVFAVEVRRLTTQMLQIVTRRMSSLKAVYFQVDERARICSCIIAFLPDAWFLEPLLSAKHLKTIGFTPGPRFAGHSQNHRNARSCINALNAVFKAYFTTAATKNKLDFGDVGGRRLQSRIGRKMLNYFAARGCYQEAASALALHVAMLETVR